MYLFFLVFLIFVSVSLIMLILLQSAHGLNNTVHSNIKNYNKSFRYIEQNSFIINVIRILSFLFFIISIVLCNINNKKIDSNAFLENSIQKNIIEDNSLNKKILNSDIPH